MNLKEILDIVALSSPLITFGLGVNLREYDDAKEWLLTHDVNRDFYEEKVNNFRKKSVRGKVCYYLGAPGRLLSYRKYTSSEHKNPSV